MLCTILWHTELEGADQQHRNNQSNPPQQWKLLEESPSIHFDSGMETHGACGSSLKGAHPFDSVLEIHGDRHRQERRYEELDF